MLLYFFLVGFEIAFLKPPQLKNKKFNIFR
jgi:hypothetical protein